MQNMNPSDESGNTDHTQGRKRCGLRNEVLNANLMLFWAAPCDIRLPTITIQTCERKMQMQSDVHPARVGILNRNTE